MNSRRYRRRPERLAREKILADQGNLCFYCGLEFILENPQFDHVIPVRHAHNNRIENFVASCGVCNLIKHCHVFDSLESAREHVQTIRKARGLPIFSHVPIRPASIKPLQDEPENEFWDITDRIPYFTPKQLIGRKRGPGKRVLAILTA